MTNCVVIFVEDGARSNITFNEMPEIGNVFNLDNAFYSIVDMDNEFVYANKVTRLNAQFTDFCVHPKYIDSNTLWDLEFNPKDNLEYQPREDDDIYSLADFIKMAESRSITGYDGFASEVIIGGRIVQDERFSPEYLLIEKSLWLELQEEKGPVSIIWYNR